MSVEVPEEFNSIQDEQQFTPEHEAYLRREIRRGMNQLKRGEYSDLTIDQIIAEERSRMAQAKKAY